MKTLQSPFFFILSLVFLLATATQLNAATINTDTEINHIEKGNNHFTFHHDLSSKNLILKSKNSNYTVEIFNDEGEVIKSFKVKKNTTIKVSTKDIKAGNYYLRYTSDNKKNNSVKKLVIE